MAAEPAPETEPTDPAGPTEPAPTTGPDDDLAWDATPPAPDRTPAPAPTDTPDATPQPRRAGGRAAVAAEPVRVLNPNGGWCWWQSPRAIVTRDGELLATSVPAPPGAGGRRRANDVTAYDLARGRADVSTVMSGRLASDDHNNGAVLELPSGRVVTAWAGHSEEPYVHVAWRDRGSATWQTGVQVHRPEAADPTPTPGFEPVANVTYANLVWAPQENGGQGRLYNFFRGRGHQPVVMVSDDQGPTWTYLGEVFARPRSRPYVHYAAGPDGRIWFTVGLGHPHVARANPVYAGYLRDGRMYRSDGTYVTDLGRPVDPSRFTLVFQSTETNPITWAPSTYRSFDDTDAWGSDLVVDATGAPVMTFTVRRPQRSPVAGKIFRQDAYWARLDPGTGRWEVVRVGDAGSELFDNQLSYTGLTSIDPTDPYRVYMATDVDPAHGAPLVSRATGRAQHEIWEGTSADGGTTWSWAPVTADSRTDNLRPLLAARDGSWALLWLRGSYPYYIDTYDQEVVGIVRPSGAPPAASTFRDRTVVARGTQAVVADLDGDGADDVLTHRPGAATDSIAFTVADGRRHARLQPVTVNGAYSAVAGDTRRDGADDVVWYDPATGALTAWMFATGGRSTSVGIGWGPKGARIRMGDLDGNGNADILLYAPGRSEIWLARRAGGWERVPIPVTGTGYRPIVGDFDGDRTSDIAWYRPGGGASTVWLMHPHRRTWTTRPFDAVRGAYSPVVGDFDGSGTDDIWFPTAGGTSRWLARAGGFTKTVPRLTEAAVAVVATSDGRLRGTLVVSAGRTVVDRRTP
ncbi:MAG TPA: FG-GAP-like repeat-containing protein [Iamia sp.]|nr:FG-GAP-like repeat-containing protein [Iamia sp.]